MRRPLCLTPRKYRGAQHCSTFKKIEVDAKNNLHSNVSEISVLVCMCHECVFHKPSGYIEKFANIQYHFTSAESDIFSFYCNISFCVVST